jgi:hypothetical protein
LQCRARCGGDSRESNGAARREGWLTWARAAVES